MARADAPPAMQPPRLMPDLTQTAKDAGLPGDGKTYCGPVAAANGLIWLSDRFPQLAPTTFASGDLRNAQIELAKTLGDKTFMNTNLTSGTGVNGVVRGVTRYLAERGFDATVTHQGWRKPPQDVTSDGERIDPQWLRSQLKPNSIVLLNIGWYAPAPATAPGKGDDDTESRDSSGPGAAYHRYSGHWIILIGYGLDAAGKPDPDLLIVHDSASRAGPEGTPTYIRLKPIEGTLTGSVNGVPPTADGMYHLEGLHRSTKAAAALLDAAVCIELHPKQAE